MKSSFTPEEIERFRAETKGVNNRIHFNNAGASLPPDEVLETVFDYLTQEAMIGGYEQESLFTEVLNDTYKTISVLINAHPDEIAIFENASMAWGVAFNGISFSEGDEILVSEMEYVTNLLGILHAAKKYGIVWKVIPDDDDGNFSLSALEAAINPRTKVIAITHIASASGKILPVKEIGRITLKYGIYYLLDACQSVGQLPVDVKSIGCDFMSVTGRKYLRAPRGTGFLYVKKAVQESVDVSFIDGHSIEWLSNKEYKLRDGARRFELYEKNRALVLGLKTAVEYALEIGMDRIWECIDQLADKMRKGLNMIRNVELMDKGNKTSGIVTFSVKVADHNTIKKKLSENGINVSVINASSTYLYMSKKNEASVIRASLHYYNTEEEVNRFCEVLQTII